MVLERSEALHKGTEWLATLAAFGISYQQGTGIISYYR